MHTLKSKLYYNFIFLFEINKYFLDKPKPASDYEKF